MAATDNALNGNVDTNSEWGIRVMRQFIHTGRLTTVTAVSISVLVLIMASSSVSNASSVKNRSDASHARTLTSVNIGSVSPNASVLGPLYLAERAGYFKQEGINPTVKFISSGTLRTLIAAGQEQFAVFGTPSGELLQLNGAPVTIIANPSHNDFTLVVGPGITSPAELKGKTIVASSNGSADEFYMLNALESVGLNLSDVNVEIAPEPADNGIFDSGTADVEAAQRPQSTLAIAGRPGSSSLSGFKLNGNPYPGTEVIAYSPYAKAHPKIAAGVLVAMYRGEQLWKRDPKAADAIIRSLGDNLLTPNEVAVTYKVAAGSYRSSFIPAASSEAGILKLFKEFGSTYAPLAASAKGNSLITTTYAKEAEKTLQKSN